MNNKKALGKTMVPRRLRRKVLADARARARVLARKDAKYARNRRAALRKLSREAL